MSLEPEFRTFCTVNPVVTSNRFRFPGLNEISPEGFRLLASCLVGNTEPDAATRLRRSFRIRTDPAFVRNRNVAEYHFRGSDRAPADTLLLASDTVFNTVFGRAVVYHEAIHALLDAYGGVVRARQNEATAYLGEALFYLACGFNLANPPAGLNTRNQTSYNTLAPIFPIATALVSRRIGNATMLVTAAEAQQLAAAMAGLVTGNPNESLNGIRGRRIVGGQWH